MKKLMVALAAVVVAAGVQAASFNWTATGTSYKANFYDVAGNDLGSATAYLFNAAIMDQNQLLTNIKGGGDIASYTSAQAKSAGITGSQLADTPFEYGEIGGNYNFYMAIYNEADKTLLLSESVPVSGMDGKTPDVPFADPGVWSDGLYGSGNRLSELSFAEGKAGWYNAAAVPEPTSGLLLLLGVAGLALRRRRA